MNSPDPASPSASTASSGSPPPEETSPHVPTGNISYLSSLTSHITATFGGGPNSSSSKRRLPGGSSFAAASSARDSKTRRRGEPGRSGNTAWDGGVKESGGKKEKDELLDQGLVEYLRKGMSVFLFHPCHVFNVFMKFSEIGDPFLEVGIKG